MLEDPRLNRRNNVRVPRRDNYQRPTLVLSVQPSTQTSSAPLWPWQIRTGMSISQVTDEVLYTGLVEMQEMDLNFRSEEGMRLFIQTPGDSLVPPHKILKVVSRISI